MAFSIVVGSGITINICMSLMVGIILIKWRKKCLYCQVLSQIFLTVLNEMLIMIQIVILIKQENSAVEKALQMRLLTLSANLAIMTFALSQWVLVYQYLKVAVLMPYILGLEHNEEKAIINEKRTRRKLVVYNITFWLVTIVCVLLNYAGQVHGIWICRQVRLL